ncbi:MAG: hypothetical protein ACFFD1_06655, partial [Candidatus Thorarchaeota archaeon]
TESEIRQLNSSIQSINQKTIEFETRFKQIDTIHTEMQNINKYLSESQQTLNTSMNSFTNILRTTTDELRHNISENQQRINSTANTLNDALKNSMNSVKESILSVADAEKTRHQSLLTALEEIPRQLSGSLSTVSGPIVSQGVKEKLDTFSKEVLEKFQNLIDVKQEELELNLKRTVENTIDKQKEILELIRSQFQVSSASGATNVSPKAVSTPVSQDLDEVRDIISFFQRSPKDKQSSIARVEQGRDLLIADRTSEAPYRVTASRIFREVLQMLSSERGDIPHHVNRGIIALFEELENHILSTK